MQSIRSLINRPLEKTLQRVQDPIQHAQITILYYVFLLNFIKIILVLPEAISNQNIERILLCVIGCFVSVFVIKIVLSKPQYLQHLIHFALSFSLFFLITNIMILNGGLTLISIQNVFMIIMWSFYSLRKKWAFFYSSLATLPLFYQLASSGESPMHLAMSQSSFFVYVAIVILNFVIIFTAYHYYNNILYRAIETREKLYEELADVYKKQSLFFSSMSHELRTPLNAVIGMASLIIDGNENKEQRENMDILKFSAENLLTLINDILDLKKMDSGMMKLEAVSFNLKDLLENACAGLKLKATEKNLYCKINIDSILEENNVVGDPTRLLQIILNLMSNAIKFTSKGGITVKVSLLKREKELALLRFSIKDTGLGLSAAQQQHIFDPYTQASLDTTREFGGTGLGLSIVKQLLDLHQSSIHLKSELLAGAEFYFDINYPLVKISTEKGVAQALIKPSAEVSELRVLLAEDDLMNILFMRKLFSRWGIRLDVAANGLEVLNLLNNKDYDVILMDIQMPEMNGYEAATKIREMEDPLKSGIHIIALTASVSVESKIKVFQAGMNDLLNKPFKPDQLYEKLQYHYLSEAT